jgi:hypothetical protein
VTHTHTHTHTHTLSLSPLFLSHTKPIDRLDSPRKKKKERG